MTTTRSRHQAIASDWARRAHFAQILLIMSFVFGTSSSGLQLSIRAVLAAVALAVALTLPQRPMPIESPMVAFLAVAAIGVFFADRPFQVVLSVGHITFVFAAAGLITANLGARAILRTFVLASIFLTSTAVVLAVAKPGLAFEPLRSPIFAMKLTLPFTHIGKNGVAMFALVTAVAVTSRQGLNKLSKAALLVLCATVILLSQSRGVMICAAVSTATGVAFRNPRALPVTGLGIALIAGAFRYAPFAADFWNRQDAIPALDSIFTSRQAIFRAAIDEFLISPVIGGGLGSADRRLFTPVGDPDFPWPSHTEAGTVLAGTGILGALMISWVLIDALGVLIDRWRQDRDWIPLSAMSFVCAMLLITPSFSRVSVVTLLYLCVVRPIVLENRSPNLKISRRWRAFSRPNTSFLR